MPSSGGPNPFGWTTSSPSSPEHSIARAWHFGQEAGACPVVAVVGQEGQGPGSAAAGQAVAQRGAGSRPGRAGEICIPPAHLSAVLARGSHRGGSSRWRGDDSY
jgi:hypothetical protein